MEHLPGQPSAGGAGVVRLTARSARALVRALAADGAERVTVLESALEDDAAFARWSADERRQRGLPAVDMAQQMAAWLAEALFDLYPGGPVGMVDEEGSALSAAAAWAAAGCAGELAAPLDAEPAARASWRAMLEAPASAPDAEGELTVAAIAVRAERALVDEGVSPSREELWNAAARWRERVTEQLAEWRAADPAWFACLAKLWPAQARLAALEARFDEALRDAKLTALKAFAYGAGHEINNPLANIASRAQSLLADESHPERRRRLAAINAQAFRAHEMLADLMLFARPPQLAPMEVDLRKELTELVAQFAAQAAEQNTALTYVDAAREVETVWADPVQLRVALAALIRNSLEALAEGGQVTVRSTPQQTNFEEFIAISIEDTGPGIPSDSLGVIFDPFYSGREAGRGLGFGLPKAWRIAEAHRGRLEAHSDPGRGATFRLWLPVPRPQQ